MVWSQGAGKVLGAKELEVVLDLEEFGFGVEVALGGHLEGACADAECLVLDALEFEDVGRRCVGEPYRGGIGEKWAD